MHIQLLMEKHTQEYFYSNDKAYENHKCAVVKRMIEITRLMHAGRTLVRNR